MKKNTKEIKIKNKKSTQGITLIALIITIIVLLILAGISIAGIFGENGLIAKAQLSAFATEMQGIKEKVDLKKNQNAVDIAQGKAVELFSDRLNTNTTQMPETLKQEILYTKAGYPSDKETTQYTEEEFNAIVDEQGNVQDVYIIDKETANGKENTYVYDKRTDVVFKIKQTNIGGKIYHSYECASLEKGGTEGETGKDLIIDKESDVIQVGDEYYYAPNMKGYSSRSTTLVYYSQDFSSQKEVPVTEYIEKGEPYQIQENGQTYTLHDYGQQIWANAKTTGNNLESWWVWVPRYAYKINGTATDPPIDVIYIDLNNQPLHPKYNGVLPEGYEVQPAFTPTGSDGSKNLKGIWMSKYEPTYSVDYIPDGAGCYPPDMTGFDGDYTYLELYDKGIGTFSEEIKLADANLGTVNQEKKWYDYPNNVWANVKTTGNNIENWWVWIPRYAYQLNPGITEPTIIFIDLNNKPIDKEIYGNILPEGYEVHPAFTPSGTDGNKNLKGIWMSKYEPSYNLDTIPTSGTCYEPNMEGFDKNNTYIELYDTITGTFSQEIKLADANLQTINQEKKWYDYPNNIWANIKTNANDLECWWVWVPRYAYLISPNITEANIIFIDLDNKPMDKQTYGDTLPANYVVHPAFTPSGNDGNKNSKGIWMSKYEPSNK